MTNHVFIVMPVYNDWTACATVVSDLDAVFVASGIKASVVVVDDGSTITPDDTFLSDTFRALMRIEVLRLHRNVGHQRAIAIALCHLNSAGVDTPVVIMDADGEDAPADVPRLLAEYGRHDGAKVVFAERRRRSENRMFRVGYWCYRTLHHALTGHRVRVGNFSVVPPSRLPGLTVSAELWSHYAAAVFASGTPFCTVPTDRARRTAGRSHMNVVQLVTHGLGAMSVFSDIVGVRLLLLSVLAGVVLSVTGLVVIGVRVWTALAVPGWATYAAGILVVLLAQVATATITFSLLVLSGRRGAGIVPIRDFAHFVKGVRSLWPRP